MAAVNEMARVSRDIATLVEVAELELRPNSRSPMKETDRRQLKGDIEACMQQLDELRARLSG